jgi:hypothetical protein
MDTKHIKSSGGPPMNFIYAKIRIKKKSTHLQYFVCTQKIAILKVQEEQ